jgi:hypothetical protein
MREHEGHFIPTGVSRMQLVQIGSPQAAQETRVSRRGWLTQCRNDVAIPTSVSPLQRMLGGRGIP